jgi:hypothetical protein
MLCDMSGMCSFFSGLILGAISLTAFSCLWKVVKVYTSRQVRPYVHHVPACWTSPSVAREGKS